MSKKIKQFFVCMMLLHCAVTRLYADMCAYPDTASKSVCVQPQAANRGLLVSTYPLYLIAKAVTQGVESPTVLLDPKQDAHHFQFKPSDLLKIKHANFILWIGATHEASLASRLAGNRNAVALLSFAKFQTKLRRDPKGVVIPHLRDTHIWFDPHYAIEIADIIANVRSQQFPKDKGVYQRNAAAFKQQMLAVIATIPKHKTSPYWAYHDAYQYFESTLGLQYQGSLTSDMDVPVSVGQLQWLQQHRTLKQPMCLIAPQGNYMALKHKLAPLNVMLLDENMYGETNFVSAWQDIVVAYRQCVFGSGGFTSEMQQ